MTRTCCHCRMIPTYKILFLTMMFSTSSWCILSKNSRTKRRKSVEDRWLAISNIMMTCVFLHKMIVEDERDLNLEFSMSMFVDVSNLVGTWTGPKHFLRPTGRWSTRPHTLSFMRITLSIIGSCIWSRLPLYSFDLLYIRV